MHTPLAQRGDKIKSDKLHDFASSMARKAARRERKLNEARQHFEAQKKAAWSAEVAQLRREIRRRMRASAVAAAPVAAAAADAAAPGDASAASRGGTAPQT